MIGPYLVLTFRWPWGLCWQLLVNFLHWGHSLTFYLSANYLTFSTYHLLFFKLLEAHPHFDTFLGKYSFFACCWDISLPTHCNIPFTQEINSSPNSGAQKHRHSKNYKPSFQFRKTKSVYIETQWYLNSPENQGHYWNVHMAIDKTYFECRIYCSVLFLCFVGFLNYYYIFYYYIFHFYFLVLMLVFLQEFFCLMIHKYLVWSNSEVMWGE